MSIEDEVFKRTKLIESALIPYGFKKNKNTYKYSKNILDDAFRIDVVIDSNGKVNGKVFDLEMDDEYTNYRVKDPVGEFVNKVLDLFTESLQDIADKCFEKEYFIFDQSNRITKLIHEKYHVTPEFLWDKFPGFGVFRKPNSDKWFGLIGNIDKSKIIAKQTGEIEVMCLKVDNKRDELLKHKGIYPAYHMNKKNWISIILDDSLSDNEIMKIIEISCGNVNVRGEWIVPANPKFYDVIGAFEKSKIITWKQSSNIKAGDIVYLYVTEPYSALMFKCQAVEVNIPYEYRSKEVSMKYVMRIKLLKKYDEKEYTFKRLNELGIRAVRGPRSITSELSEELNKSK